MGCFQGDDANSSDRKANDTKSDRCEAHFFGGKSPMPPRSFDFSQIIQIRLGIWKVQHVCVPLALFCTPRTDLQHYCFPLVFLFTPWNLQNDCFPFGCSLQFMEPPKSVICPAGFSLHPLEPPKNPLFFPVSVLPCKTWRVTSRRATKPSERPPTMSFQKGDCGVCVNGTEVKPGGPAMKMSMYGSK